MEIQRCVHCGLESDGVHSPPHKSTCRTTGKPETYVSVRGQDDTKPRPKPKVEATPEKSSTKITKKTKGRK